LNGAKRKRPIRVFLASIIVIVAYFALFPYPLGRELVARPVWAADLSAAQTGVMPESTSAGSEAPASFRLGGVFGYVTLHGEVQYMDRPLFGVMLTDAGFINYSRIGTTWFFQDQQGRKKFSFSGEGYPLLSDDAGRLFTVKSDTTGVRELDRNGDTIWSRDFPSLVTSLSVQPDYLLAGLLSGVLQLVDRRGALAAEYAPAESRIPVILGCAVSADGSLIAAVSGIDPQTLVVLERRENAYRLASQLVLGSQFRREVRIRFSPDMRTLVLEGDGAARIYDIRSREISALTLPGGLSSFTFLPDRRVAVFLGGDPSRRELVVAKSSRSLYSREFFPASATFLGRIGDGILLGIDSRLLRIDLEEM
jgi:hypothetical protein